MLYSWTNQFKWTVSLSILDLLSQLLRFAEPLKCWSWKYNNNQCTQPHALTKNSYEGHCHILLLFFQLHFLFKVRRKSVQRVWLWIGWRHWRAWRVWKIQSENTRLRLSRHPMTGEGWMAWSESLAGGVTKLQRRISEGGEVAVEAVVEKALVGWSQWGLPLLQFGPVEWFLG